MITITLQFSTLNAAIKVLREIPEAALAAHAMVAEPSVDEMSAALQAKNAIAQAAAPAAQEAAVPAPKSRANPAPSKPTAKEEEAVAPAKTADASPPPAASADPAAPASTAVVTFEELKKAFLALSTKNMPACKAVLVAMGVEKLSGLAPDQYAAAMDYIKAQAV